jgi:hypothetical protein
MHPGDTPDTIRHTPKVISLRTGAPMITYEPTTAELADDSP